MWRAWQRRDAVWSTTRSVRDQQQHKPPYRLPGRHYKPGWPLELPHLRWRPPPLPLRQIHRPPKLCYILFDKLHRPVDLNELCSVAGPTWWKSWQEHSFSFVLLEYSLYTFQINRRNRILTIISSRMFLAERMRENWLNFNWYHSEDWKHTDSSLTSIYILNVKKGKHFSLLRWMH